MRLSHELSDEALLTATPRFPDAFAAFYRRHVEAVLRFFLSRTKDPDVAADLMAETFAAALISVERYSEERAAAEAWLFAIARHKLVDSYRSGTVRAEAREALGLDVLELDDADIERLIDLSDTPNVLPLLAELPTEQREAVQARVVDEESYRDIACRLQISEAVVRKRVSRGLGRLKTRLEGTS